MVDRFEGRLKPAETTPVRRPARASGSGDAVLNVDLCVIGAGAGGLSVAAGAAQMGAKTVLIERHVRAGLMGGECLHTGCVPSKALLAAAKQAHAMRHADKFGLERVDPKIDYAKVHQHVTGVINAIGPIDSVDRFEDLGVTVLQAEARFTGKRTLDADGVTVKARRFVIATGSKPAIPPIPGIDTVPILTNENLFDLTEAPQHLVIIGGGAIGMEMAQAHRRLGCEVTVLEAHKVLPRDDRGMADMLADMLRGEGASIEDGAEIVNISPDTESGVRVDYRKGGQAMSVRGSHLLVAAGRSPVTDGLALDAAGVTHSRQGIKVDARLRTSNKRIFALGDCIAGAPRLTHVAGYQAGIVIRNVLFAVPAKADYSQVPQVTYTDPELAHVGLAEDAARAKHGDDLRVMEWSYGENDRAQADHETRGHIKVMTRKNGKLLGVSILGAHAGEILQPWLLALSKKMKISAFTGYIPPYPTYGELNKRAAGQFFTPTLFGPRTQFLVRLLQKLP